MSPCEPLYTPTFKTHVKNHPHLQDRIKDLVGKILDEPLHSQSHLLGPGKKVDLSGKRARHLSGNYVVVYMYCKECIDNEHKGKFNDCSFCETYPEDTVIFVAFAKHDNIYAKKWSA